MKIPEFEIYRLIIFYYVAREKSISTAAHKLFLTQPAVTSHIKNLEKLTQLKLIEVKNQRITLTPAGEGLYQYAKEIYEQSILAGRFVELTRESSLNIGITPLFNSIVAPLITTMFDELYPRVKITVECKESHYLITDVLDSTIDLGVVATRGPKNLKLSYTPIIDEIELIFYASPANPIFSKERIGWEDLSNYPLIVGSEMSIIRPFLGDKLKLELRRGPSIISNSDLNKRLVRNGNFIGVTLFKDIEDDLRNNTLRVVPFPDAFTVGVNIIAYTNTSASAMVKKFISLAKSTFDVHR